MRDKIVVGNWKMNGQQQRVIQLTNQLNELVDLQINIKIVIVPPTLYLPLVNERLDLTRMSIGAQNVFPKDFGAYTGEHSAPMLKEYHCAYVLVGHSERRHYFYENEKFVAQKFHHVKDHGMIPVLCVGETLVDRQKGQTKQIIADQLLAVYENNQAAFGNCIVAYEPVWAIGTGKTATPDEAQEVHQHIRRLVANISESDAEKLPILYGGSVNNSNAKGLFSMPDIDGCLVGGASLDAKQFVEIIKCIN